MNKPFIQKHPYIATILVGLLCTFITALGMAVPQIIGLDTNPTYIVATVSLIISVVIGIIIMKNSKHTLSYYGLRKSNDGSHGKVLWYIPLIALEILPIAICGFSSENTPKLYIILLFFTIMIGINEEIYFRGIALRFLEEKGRKKAIIWSSIFFGILHLANALNDKKLIYLVLQMLFAFLVGFVLSEIVSITRSLWLVIIWHAAHDFIAMTTNEPSVNMELIILIIQVALLLGYSIIIWKKIKEEEPVNINAA